MEELENRLTQLNEYIENIRTVIQQINKEITSGELNPTEQQRTLIDNIAQRGRDSLGEISILEGILGQDR